MKDNLAGAVWRLVVFMVVCLFGIFAIFAVFSQLRFGAERTYNAT
ncbi:MAG: phospholipid/cholesterol/gamma-HCH transport system substrate-binding protein, partial [Mycobacterium sp.]|nr:phospholipid/cholesterol/gamma-HCH transport system substrate-binding protein [Mycobacterium sp.]